MFAGEHLAGPAEPGLHFVEDEERTEFIAEPSDSGQVVVRGNVDAALALDRFEQH